MKKDKYEIRTCGLTDVHVREVEGEEDSRIIEGTAIVFNVESKVLDDFGVPFREVILPEAVQMPFLNSQDIKLNIMHDRKDTVARSLMGVGNLHYNVDGKGVNFWAKVPKCDICDRALELTRVGVLTGCSFEFIPGKPNIDYIIEERGANKEVRVTHKRFAKITAFTLAMDPAYSQTSCNAREMWNETPTAKREAEEAEAAKKAEEQKQREQTEREKVLARERELAAAQRMAREREIELLSY